MVEQGREQKRRSIAWHSPKIRAQEAMEAEIREIGSREPTHPPQPAGLGPARGWTEDGAAEGDFAQA